ncbi:hypothetical protein AAT19DRAFT_12804 [Rhodotorula toruloides]|uniref:Uncharacterized protein n=1 Tax=Rhodotorula toruloides TaxID=5286 RepID=A0A2T0ACQ5_RHOTO|nr:hypothetical protein AAT19DRAFT_12804 [Rhodotorula toruloides]
MTKRVARRRSWRSFGVRLALEVFVDQCRGRAHRTATRSGLRPARAPREHQTAPTPDPPLLPSRPRTLPHRPQLRRARMHRDCSRLRRRHSLTTPRPTSGRRRLPQPSPHTTLHARTRSSSSRPAPTNRTRPFRSATRRTRAAPPSTRSSTMVPSRPATTRRAT